jgi:hypothetical protein
MLQQISLNRGTSMTTMLQNYDIEKKKIENNSTDSEKVE